MWIKTEEEKEGERHDLKRLRDTASEQHIYILVLVGGASFGEVEGCVPRSSQWAFAFKPCSPGTAGLRLATNSHTGFFPRSNNASRNTTSTETGASWAGSSALPPTPTQRYKCHKDANALIRRLAVSGRPGPQVWYCPRFRISDYLSLIIYAFYCKSMLGSSGSPKNPPKIITEKSSLGDPGKRC